MNALQLPVDTPLNFTVLALNLGVGVFMALVLRWHYSRFGSTLSNREEFAQVFPFILLTTILIITVVKSSLALSLGLVGALSIVRFRTPIKEPEELAYLFMAIALGLGLGANQTLTTVFSGLAILSVLTLLKWTRRDVDNKNLFLSIDIKDVPQGESNFLAKLNEVISAHVVSSNLRRYDVRENGIEATYLLDLPNAESLGSLLAALHQVAPSMGITFLDQNQLPSI